MDEQFYAKRSFEILENESIFEDTSNSLWLFGNYVASPSAWVFLNIKFS
jgi:hypothetical protein